MSRQTTNIVLAGVGGQGSVLSTRILAEAARRAGRAVVTSEVHGMSQRGGTVVTAVRWGADELAPVVPEGEADLLVAFERLEAARHLDLLRPGGLAVVGDERITPLIEALRSADYPDDLEGLARARDIDLELFPALRTATELGNPKLAGVALLGVVSHHVELPLHAWRGAIAETVPAGTVDANLAAFTVGHEWGVGPVHFSF
ncbi:MAG: indolepyruvate oxidoreductase subunit beta [Gemmatimonadota bacterium]|jgi:indolepyruvate ferredoxin oxidoreductase beta subunit